MHRTCWAEQKTFYCFPIHYINIIRCQWWNPGLYWTKGIAEERKRKKVNGWLEQNFLKWNPKCRGLRYWGEMLYSCWVTMTLLRLLSYLKPIHTAVLMYYKLGIMPSQQALTQSPWRMNQTAHSWRSSEEEVESPRMSAEDPIEEPSGWRDLVYVREGWGREVTTPAFENTGSK